MLHRTYYQIYKTIQYNLIYINALSTFVYINRHVSDLAQGSLAFAPPSAEQSRHQYFAIGLHMSTSRPNETVRGVSSQDLSNHIQDGRTVRVLSI